MRDSWQTKYQAYALAASPVFGLYVNIAHQHGRYAYLQIPFTLTDVSKIDVLNGLVTGLLLWLCVALWAVLLFLPAMRRKRAIFAHVIVNTALVTFFVTGLNPEFGASSLSVFITYALIGAATMLSYGASIYLDDSPGAEMEREIPKQVIPIAYLNTAVFLAAFAGLFSFSLGYFSEKNTAKRLHAQGFADPIVVNKDSARMVLKPYNPKDSTFSRGTVRVISPPPSDVEISENNLRLKQK